METKKFKREDAIELTEANVIAIYNACLATKDTPSENIIHTKFSDNPNVPTAHFNYEILRSYRWRIQYMLGQLMYVHKYDPKHPYANDFKPSTGAVNYKGQPWTKSSKNLGLFYYIEQGAGNIETFDDKNITYLLEIAEIIPTLSPNDPAFSAWAKDHIEG